MRLLLLKNKFKESKLGLCNPILAMIINFSTLEIKLKSLQRIYLMINYSFT